MTKSNENLVAALKLLIDQNGPEYLDKEPYEVYKELIKSGNTDPKTVGAILCFLVNGMLHEAGPDTDATVLSKAIRNGCGFDKAMSDRLAAVFTALYSRANQTEWKDRESEGLLQFMEENFTVTWKGESVWDAGNGTMDCHYTAQIVLTPTKRVMINDGVVKLIRKNPFVKKEEIAKYFAKELKNHLDNEFEEHCTCDDYYPPVVEDFELEYLVKEWSERNGFKVLSCEGDGILDDYEPKYRGRWY